MISVDAAMQIILNAAEPVGLEIEQLPLHKAIGGLLAQSVESRLDFPHWDNSAMDGYAVRYEDVAEASQENFVELEIITEIPAGSVPKGSIRSGQAARILTGSMLPEGADTVVMQEWTTRSGNRLQINQAPPQLGHFVRHQGSFYRSGEPLLRSGLRIGGPEIAVLAAAQCLSVPVFKRLRVEAFIDRGNRFYDRDCGLAGQKSQSWPQLNVYLYLCLRGFEWEFYQQAMN